MKLRILIPALVIVAAGCGSGSKAEEPLTNGESKPALTIALVFDEAGRGDKSFNDSAARGLDQVAEELKARTREIDSKSASDYKPNFESLVFDKPDLIIGVGVSMDSALHEAAKANPSQKFALIDTQSRADNVLGVTFKEEEGSFLAGLLAGMTTKSNRVGFVGGKNIPLIKKFEVGFRAGVLTANPNAVVTAKYTEDWSDIQKGKEAALSLYNTGADIVYHAAGRCGLGVINAAKEKGKLAIGVDSDQDHIEPGSVLTSMVKSVDKAVFEAARMVRDGTFKGRTLELGIKEGYIGLSEPKDYTKPLMPNGALEAVDEAKKMISDGALIVPKSEAELASFKPPRLASLQ